MIKIKDNKNNQQVLTIHDQTFVISSLTESEMTSVQS